MIKFDDLGPEKLLEVFDPDIQLHGFLVIDNTTLGPAKGGLRMTPFVSIEEIASLARAMTYKCAIAEVPFGGGKSGIVADLKRLNRGKKFELISSFSKAIKAFCPRYYITAPDVGTGEEEMAEFIKANGSFKSATGKPADMCLKPGIKCGIPHELGSTGFGVAKATVIASEFSNLKLANSSIAVAGFGNVGSFAASFLAETGAKIVAVSDSTGTIYNQNGLDISKVKNIKHDQKTITKYQPAKVLPAGQIFNLKVDVLIPSALGDVITAKNMKQVRAKIIVEGANLPLSNEAEEYFYHNKILVIPDIVANAGGVISSYAEYRGFDPVKMFKLVEKKITNNTKKILILSKEKNINPRHAALLLASQRLKLAKR